MLTPLVSQQKYEHQTWKWFKGGFKKNVLELQKKGRRKERGVGKGQMEGREGRKGEGCLSLSDCFNKDAYDLVACKQESLTVLEARKSIVAVPPDSWPGKGPLSRWLSFLYNFTWWKEVPCSLGSLL